MRKGIYSDGMIESYQAQGENINIYPEVTGPITRILVPEGQAVHQGDPLLAIDDSVQRATAEQQKAQAEAAATMLSELKAEPRRETLAIAVAQVENAKATLKNAQDQLEKQQHSFDMDPKSISEDALDNARNAERIAATNLEVVQRQYTLTKAGAWMYDVQNQERTYTALWKSYLASDALLAKYTIRAPSDGIVLAVHSSVGSYVSTQGAYDSYTQGFDPLIVMGPPQVICRSAPMSTRYWCRAARPEHDPGGDVHPRHHIARAADLRAHPALHLAENRAVGRAGGAGRSARAPGHLPLREATEAECLSGTAGGCLCIREIAAGWRRSHPP